MIKTHKNKPKSKRKPEPTVNFKNCSHVCAYMSLCTTFVQHRTALTIFPP